MIIIQDVLVSDELVEEQFICNLSKCKGACCWEGDFGAPLLEEELESLDNIYDDVRPYLTEEGQNKIDTEGGYKFFKGMEQNGTALHAAQLIECVLMVARLTDLLLVKQCDLVGPYNNRTDIVRSNLFGFSSRKS